MNTRQFISKINLLSILITSLAILCLASQAQAASNNFNFTLSGAEQVPPNASAGTGSCNVVLDDVTGAVSVSCNFSGLSSVATAAHIHGLAGPGINAGVILALTATAATSGTITGNGIISAAQVTGMIGGLTYINLHSSMYPGGELRGQVTTTSSPIPSTSNSFLFAMVILLLLAGAFALRRRTA